MPGGVGETVETGIHTNVDELDVKIIARLVNDSRIPFRQLARELGVSESTIYMRVRRLKERGILKGFTACLDLNRLGLVQQVYIEVKASPQHIRNVVEELVSYPNVLEVYEVSGEYPLLIKVASTSSEELTSTVDRIALIKGVTEMDVKYVFKTLESEGVRKIFLRA
ncbi:MAG: Lrp/AsnC family transcriptional regulator [Zestosphaera sp.]